MMPNSPSDLPREPWLLRWGGREATASLSAQAEGMGEVLRSLTDNAAVTCGRDLALIRYSRWLLQGYSSYAIVPLFVDSDECIELPQ